MFLLRYFRSLFTCFYYYYRVSWICSLLFSSGACFPAPPNGKHYHYLWTYNPPETWIKLYFTSLHSAEICPDSGQTSSDASPSAERFGTGPGPDSSAGGWSFGAGGSTGGRDHPGSSAGDWTFGAGGLTRGGSGPGSSVGSWSLSDGGSGAGSRVSGASGHTREVAPRQASSGSFVGGFPQHPAVSSPLFHTWNWIPSRHFPDFSAWYTYKVPVSMVAPHPQMPSSYVVQSGSGYKRGREVLSHSKYSDNVFGYPPLSPVLPQYPGVFQWLDLNGQGSSEVSY